MVKCFYCHKELPQHTASQISYDRPYINVYFHKECENIVNKLGADEYIEENKQRFLELVAQNKVEFGTRQPAPEGKQAKSKILTKPTKKTRANKPLTKRK